VFVNVRERAEKARCGVAAAGAVVRAATETAGVDEVVSSGFAPLRGSITRRALSR